MGRRNQRKRVSRKEIAASRQQSVSALVGLKFGELKHHARRCRDKVDYLGEVEAEAAARECSEKFGCEFYTYVCPWCGRWHLTTHPWEAKK